MGEDGVIVFRANFDTYTCQSTFSSKEEEGPSRGSDLILGIPGQREKSPIFRVFKMISTQFLVFSGLLDRIEDHFNVNVLIPGF